MTPTDRFLKAKGEAKDTLESAVAATPSASPEEVRKLCEEVTETARTLAAVACNPWENAEPLAWRNQINHLVRARRFALGLPVCARRGCPEEARPVFAGVATIRLCEEHGEAELSRLRHINPELVMEEA